MPSGWVNVNSSLEGKRILVTGAAAGIGLGIARACATAGASLIVVDIDYGRLVQSTRGLVDDPESLHTAELDVSSPPGVRTFFEDLEKRFGTLDGLVNNAGVTLEADFLSFEAGDLERLWSTNLRSVFLLCQESAKLMMANGGGAIVNVGSNHSLASIPGYEMYAATKGGIAAMTRAMSWSLGAYGIRVNTLCPGLTHTEAVARTVGAQPSLSESFNRLHASRRYATVDEIGATAAFLLSDGAAAITGAEIVADHGMSALLCRSEDLK